MLMKLKALVVTVMLAAVSISSAAGEGMPKPWWQDGGQDEKSNGSPTVEVAGLGTADARMVSTKTTKCKNNSKNPSLVPVTGNSVIDTRCKLVAFEVCMNEEIGVISQSQDARKQCAIMKGLGGENACRQPCIKAAKLPVGGDGVVVTHTATYKELTPYAVSCYKKRMDSVGNKDNDCNYNHALQCLMNGSKSPDVNAAILRERKNACKSFQTTYGGACVPCSGENVRVNYDPSTMDLDSKYCTPALAAAKYCTMPAPGVGN